LGKRACSARIFSCVSADKPLVFHARAVVAATAR
jgi:hypothetical protein